MLTLDEIIEFENENTNLDFKSKEYEKGEYRDLIKDVLAMANSPTKQPKYIIIGVKEDPGGKKEFIGLNSLTDQANLENVIQENIEPLIHFSYYPHIYKGRTYGVIEIDGNTNQPYMMKKDYKGLFKGDIWIRKGSRQSKATREDLDRMINFSKTNNFDKSIKIGWTENFEDTLTINIPKIDSKNRPSNIARKKYEEKLASLRKYKNNGDVSEQKESQGILTTLGLMGKLYPEYDSEKGAIKTGTTQYGLAPVYRTEKELLDIINNIENEYYEEDYYYFYEENSLKLNFSFLNDGHSFLEDVAIKFWFDKDVFLIAKDLPEKPLSDMEQIRKVAIKTNMLQNTYPIVSVEKDNIKVEEYFDTMRHKEVYRVFSEDLRVLINKNKLEGHHSISFEISARNLYEPIEGELTIDIQSEL